VVGDPASLKIAALCENEVIPLKFPFVNSTVDEPFKYTKGTIVETVAENVSDETCTETK
jgi:hypothetical protein